MGSGPFKVEVDLMQPLDPEKKPAVHATPLNHIGLWIDKLPEAVELGSPRRVCVLHLVVFAKARQVLTSLFCTPKPMMNFPSVVRAC